MEEGWWDEARWGGKNSDRKWMEVVLRHGQRKKDGVVRGGGEAQAARGRKIWEVFGIRIVCISAWWNSMVPIRKKGLIINVGIFNLKQSYSIKLCHPQSDHIDYLIDHRQR